MSDNADAVDALDHIMRVANASRTQTRRLRWIAARCADVLGLGGDWREIDLPKNRDYIVNRNQRLGLENAKLKQGMREIYEVWAGSEGLVVETASEAYQTMLIEQMRDIAALHLKEKS